jgi:hypothetical protein
MPFTLVGVVASLTTPVAKSGVGGVSFRTSTQTTAREGGGYTQGGGCPASSRSPRGFRTGGAVTAFSSRRQFLANGVPAISGLLLGPAWSSYGQLVKPVTSATITEGALKVSLRDNSQSPRDLSGLASLVNQRDALKFDAFDPDSSGASAGLNFEHIISGHKNPNNAFAPRRGNMPLYPRPDGKSAMLVRRWEDDPWAMSSTLVYTLTKPHYIDLDFRCVPHDPALFGKRRYAILFFANYMNDANDVAIHFRGIERADQPETWIAADAPKGHPDWNQGGTYRSASASGLAYDSDHNFKLNSWSYLWPRFTKPFYYGRSAKGMTLILMFNKMCTEDDEIRFSLFRFKLPRFPRPAWDFQYVIRNIQADKEYGFKARLVWKRFVSPEDCLDEYTAWRSRRVQGWQLSGQPKSTIALRSGSRSVSIS